ncbi:WD40 repeat domain-containing protein [Streptomyces sp. NPDC005732]|uniref:WD40 repeat domain-containing protein n=1 Tax=Streptomyces sp. NPDC005732 TaxID=3157057 RepID=UPI0033EF8536
MIAVDDPFTEGFGEALDQQLEVVRTWWSAGSGQHDGFRETVLLKPRERYDIETFLHEQQIRETPQDVPLVLYVSSHGELSTTRRHFLRLPATDVNRLPATAIATNEVVLAALSSPSRHVLVLLNACHAQAVADELGKWVDDLMPEPGGSLTVIAATDTDSQVQAMEFAVILGKAHRRLREVAEITRPHLTVGEFVNALEMATDELNAERGNTGTEDELPGPRTVLPGRQSRHVPTLPNPGYRVQRSLVREARRDVSTPVDELDQWLSHAVPGDPGWYFCGRILLTSKIAEFLGEPAGVLIICGATASGKSSLLARTVTLSEPTVCDDPAVRAALDQTPPSALPGRGAVDVAVSARQRSSSSLLEAIATRLPVPVPGPPPPGADPVRHWRDHINTVLSQRAQTPLTLVIDALDEAHNPTSVIRDVLEPLVARARKTPRPRPKIPAQAPSPSPSPDAHPPRPLRLILAVRSSTALPAHDPHAAADHPPDLVGDLTAAFPHARIVHTDTPDITDDIAEYTHALLDEALWAHDDPGRHSAAASTIAAHVGHSFLDARLAAEQLIQSGPDPVDDPRWPLQLQQGTLGLFLQDLQYLREHDDNPEPLITLLRASAFALGRGLPRADIWPAVARCLDTLLETNIDSHIQRLLRSRLAGYLTQDIEDDRRVYRPAHEQLARLLRHWPTKGDMALSHPEHGELSDPATRQTHARIAVTLARLAHSDPDGQPPPYLARHLARHAVHAQALDDDHLPATLLPWVTGDTIRGQLHHPHPPHARRTWLTAWAAIEPYLQLADLPSRSSSLQLAHTALAFPGIPTPATDDDTAQLPGSCVRVLWSQWALPVNVLATTRQHCAALAITREDSRPQVAIGSETGSIDLIDARTGSTLGDRIHAHDGAVRCLLLIDDGSRTLLVSGSTDGHVRVWDATNRLLVHQFLRRRNTWIADLTGYRAPDGEVVLTTVNSDGEVTQWREDHGEQVLTEMTPHPGERSAFALLTTTTADGTPLYLICAGATLRIWAADTRQLLHERDLDAAVRVLAATPDQSLIVTGHQDGTVTVWDVTTGDTNCYSAGNHPVTALACVDLDHHRIVAIAQSARIDLRELSSGHLLGTLTGHTDTITALCSGTETAAAVLISCARDDTLRTWNRQDLLAALTQQDAAPATITAAACHTSATGLRLAVSYRTPRVQIWNPDTGRPGAGLNPGQPVSALAWAPTNDPQPHLLYAGPDHTIQIWDPATEQDALQPLEGHILPIRSIAACHTPSGRTFAVSGSDDHTVRLWDLADPHPLRTWHHHYSVRAVAAALTGPNNTMQIASGSADGTVRLWNPSSTEPFHTLRCDQGFIHAIALDAHTPDGPLLATAGDDTLRLWNLHDHTPRSPQLQGHTDTIEALTAWTILRPTPRSYIASAARDGTIRIWDASTSRCILLLATGTRVLTLTAHPQHDQSAALMTIAGEAGIAVFELRLEGL